MSRCSACVEVIEQTGIDSGGGHACYCDDGDDFGYDGWPAE
jgi:hypothetical protein